MAYYRYKVLADTLLILHAIWVLILVGGTVFLINHRWYIPYHLSIVSGTLMINLILGGCPLTLWEEKSRKIWNPRTESYNNSFIAAHLKRLTNIEFSPKQINWTLFGIKVISYYISFMLLIAK